MIFGERFYSVAELADVTGYHRDSIYRAIDCGALVAAKPRGKWLIAGAAINAWLYSKHVPSAGPQSDAAPARALGPVVAAARLAAPAPARNAAAVRRASSGARGSFRE